MDVEDYPGQKDESRRERIIKRAVELADMFICSHSNGTVEELDYLTAKVAEAFVLKVSGKISSALLTYDLNLRMKKKAN